MKEFQSRIQRPPGVGTWHYVEIPFDTTAAYGQKGQIRVKGALNGIAFQSTLLPDGNGGHYLVVGGEIRSEAGVDVGDTVTIIMERDDSPRTVELHPEFEAALAASPAAKAAFDKLAYSHRKEHAEAIAEAKRPETRARRIEKAIAKLQGDQ